MLLSPEQIELLSWLNEQTEQLSCWKMGKMNAPSFTRPRVEKMYKSGLLDRDFGFNEKGEPFGKYNISDKGRAALLEAKQISDQQAQEKAQQEESLELQRKQACIAEKTYKAAVVQTAISLISFILGLLVEHYTGFINFFCELFP